MLQSLLNAWKLPDLRKRLLFTAGMIAIYRFGSFVPVPGVDLNRGEGAHAGRGRVRLPQPVRRRRARAAGGVRAGDHAVHHGVDHLPVAGRRHPAAGGAAEGRRGGRPRRSTSTPATSPSCWPWSSRWATSSSSGNQGAFAAGNPLTPTKFFIIVFTLTVGTALVMWLGELITQRGIGNGISLIIFASIVSRLPGGVYKLFSTQNPFVWLAMIVDRAGVGGRGGLRAGGTAPHPGAVRQARGGPQDVRRAEHVPAAAHQHGGGHPGHLRVVDPAVPGDHRADDPVDLGQEPRRRSSAPARGGTCWPRCC